ncbi:MAG: class I SAM-dependent methyltransferase [Phycisphaerae bacterium]
MARSEVGTREFFAEIEAYRFEKLHYLPRLVDFGGHRGRRVLDVGCGVGNDLSRFAAGGADVVGIDLAEHSIQLSRRNFAQRDLCGRFLVTDGEALALPAESFDVVYCHTVLHFTPDPARRIAEIHRVLRPNGLAIIMTVNRHSWLKLLSKVMRVEIDHLDAPIFREYSRREFGGLLSAFSCVRIVPERFPVATRVHGGVRAMLYNRVFVGAFSLLPGKLVAWSGHHLMAFASKSPRPETSQTSAG